MNRITIETEVDPINFGYNKYIFKKDGVEFAKCSQDLLRDILACTDFSEEETLAEWKYVLKYELKDISLEDELEEVFREFYDSKH